MSSTQILGARIAQVDALEKAVGRAVFTADMSFPRMLMAKIVRSPIAHGILRNIDSAAPPR